MNGLREQLVHYLFLNKDEFVASGQLQRMIWKNRGKTATPRSVVRRLEEAENMCQIAVSYKNGSAQYRWIPHEWRERYVRAIERKNLGLSPNTLWKSHAEAEKKVQPQLQYSV